MVSVGRLSSSALRSTWKSGSIVMGPIVRRVLSIFGLLATTDARSKRHFSKLSLPQRMRCCFLIPWSPLRVCGYAGQFRMILYENYNVGQDGRYLLKDGLDVWAMVPHL